MRVLIVLLAAAIGAPGAGWNVAGVRLYARGQYREAETAFRKALEEGTARERAVAMGNLGSTLSAEGRFGEAERWLADSLRGLEEAAGAESTDAGLALERLGAFWRERGDSEKAEAYLLRAAAVMEKRLDETAPERLSNRQLLALVYIDQRRYAEAEPILKIVAEQSEGVQAVAARNSLAAIALAEQRFGDAEQLANAALERARTALPADHPTIAAILNNLAQAYRFQGHNLEAETAYRQAIEVWERALGPEHPDLARGLINLAAFDHERGYDGPAESLYRRAAAILERALGAAHPQTLVARNELAEVLRAERRYTESEKLGQASLAGLEKALRPDDPRVLRAIGNHAHLLAETKRPEQAAAEFKRAHQGYR